MPVQIAEDFLLEFHRRHPGCTSQAFAQGGQEGIGGSSYELLVEVALAEESSIVDLGCGDGHLLR
ncbi:MAG: class I SAM-dependent methyltransferase, partial [Kofleriaceae bacterium]|nr:class I SAM-dependent methyltransferase [Kofleriaceae bacterium]